jgi:hypothetical protein
MSLSNSWESTLSHPKYLFSSQKHQTWPKILVRAISTYLIFSHQFQSQLHEIRDPS